MGYLIDGVYYPETGERVRHKAMGWRGVYLDTVTANKSRRHYRVRRDDGRVVITLDSDWLADDEQQQA